MNITIEIKIKWLIKGVTGYGFGTDKNLYNLMTNRKIKQSLNGRCIGYWIGKEFYSLTKLRTLIYLHKEQNILPF